MYQYRYFINDQVVNGGGTLQSPFIIFYFCPHGFPIMRDHLSYSTKFPMRSGENRGSYIFKLWYDFLVICSIRLWTFKSILFNLFNVAQRVYNGIVMETIDRLSLTHVISYHQHHTEFGVWILHSTGDMWWRMTSLTFWFSVSSDS